MYQNGDSIDGKALIAAVRELAAQRPDFVYPANPRGAGPRCYYTTGTGKPDCIIGGAMDRIGQALPAQLREDNNECFLLDEPVSSETWETALNNISRTEYKWLGDVQRNQDQGVPWGMAVADADRRYPC